MIEILKTVLGVVGIQPQLAPTLGLSQYTQAMFVTNASIGIAYFFIAAVLVSILTRVRSPLHSVLVTFSVFFFACGAYRFLELVYQGDLKPWAAIIGRVLVSFSGIASAISLFAVRDKIIALVRAYRLSQDQKHQLQRRMEELRQSEERFRLLIQGVRDYAIFLLDPKGQVESWNSGAQAMKGYNEREILGQHCSVFYTPEDLEAGAPEKDLKLALETGRSENEGWKLRKDGVRFWANTIISPIHNSNGELIGFAKVTRDLTERQRAENALKQSQKFLDSMFENIPNMIFVKDAKDLRFVRFNRAGEQLLGYPREEFIGKNDYDFFPKEQADFFTAQDRKVLSGGKVLDIPDETIQTRHQGVRTLHTRKIPILDADGCPRYLLGISEDITDQKLAEQESLRAVREQAALAERESAANRAAFLAEASTLLASSLDYHENLKKLADLVVPVLADWCTITILNEDQQPERVAMVHTDPEKQRAVEEFISLYPTQADKSEGIKRVIESGRSFITFEVTDSQLVAAAQDEEHLRIMRTLGCTSCMIVPVLSRDKIHGALTFVSSSPEYRFSSEDVRIAEELGRRAGIAIDNALLYEAAQKAVETRDEFLSIASHELKTPITALKLQLQVARRGTIAAENLAPSPARLEKLMDTSIHQVNRLTALIDDLLDVSRIEAGRLSFKFQEFDLADLASKMVERFEEHVRANGCTIHLEAPEPVMMCGDPFRMEQVILNLLSNAAKYGNRKPIVMKVLRKDRCARLVCKDQGIGIPADRVSHIFERFERAVHYSEISGLGLGLYITSEIVKAHHGTIQVNSELNQGSEFILDFPEFVEALICDGKKIESPISGRSESGVAMDSDERAEAMETLATVQSASRQEEGQTLA